jgi:hypothetical protein
MTGGHPQASELHGAGSHAMTNHMRICQHCGLPYDWRRSPSGSLKMTYCGSLCEKAELGFTIESLLVEMHVVRLDWRELLAA